MKRTAPITCTVCNRTDPECGYELYKRICRDCRQAWATLPENEPEAVAEIKRRANLLKRSWR